MSPNDKLLSECLPNSRDRSPSLVFQAMLVLENHCTYRNNKNDFISDASGKLSLEGQAVVDAAGCHFNDASQYILSRQDLSEGVELGRGRFGTVFKVIHHKQHQPMGRFKGCT
jgi:hypothetical protein